MPVHPFAPICDETSRILILGSFPSVKSRENHFYYGHPQNRFWKVMAHILRCDVPSTIPEKTAMLLTHHVAIWDVLASCEITGSSDASIKNPVPNDIGQVTRRADLAAVFCNGSKSRALFDRYLAHLVPLPVYTLPSTSPANAQFRLERLCAVWQETLGPYL